MTTLPEQAIGTSCADTKATTKFTAKADMIASTAEPAQIHSMVDRDMMIFGAAKEMIFCTEDPHLTIFTGVMVTM